MSVQLANKLLIYCKQQIRFICYAALTKKNLIRQGTIPYWDIERSFGTQAVKTIFDVGAHQGESLESFVRDYPEAQKYCFEPSPSSFKILAEKVADLDNVAIYEFALGSEPGQKELHLSSESSLCNSFAVTEEPGVGSSCLAEIDTLENFVARNKISQIDILKIDVEGFEREVLAGARSLLESQRIKMLYIECELVETDYMFVSVDELGKILGEFGYKIFGIYDQTLRWGGYQEILHVNCLFVAPELVRCRLAKT